MIKVPQISKDAYSNDQRRQDFNRDLKNWLLKYVNPSTEGDPAYVYIAYASDANGSDFSLTYDENLDYIGILNTTKPITPVAADFAGLWKKYSGDFDNSIALIGDVTASGITGTDIDVTLKDVNTNVGSFGGQNKTITVNVDSKGRILSVEEQTFNSGVDVFINLNDSFDSYVGRSKHVITINDDETGLDSEPTQNFEARDYTVLELESLELPAQIFEALEIDSVTTETKKYLSQQMVGGELVTEFSEVSGEQSTDISAFELLQPWRTGKNLYVEFVKTGDNITQINYWQDQTKVEKLFTKDITYTGSNITQTVITNEVTAQTLTVDITYTGDEITTITKTLS